MKTIKTTELKGGEYLTKPAITKEDKVLLYEGTCVHPAMINTLLENGIEEVTIHDEEAYSRKPLKIIREEVRTDCQKKMKAVMDNYCYKEDGSLEEITEAAEEIMEDIFSKEEITEKVYDIKERSADLYDHSVTVAALSVITAIKMNLEKNEIYSIGVGSLLHDIGLKYISVDYRDEDVNALSPENLFEYKKHTIYGFSSVEKEKWMSSVSKKIILFHHEKINGTGYPLKQHNLPIEVRVVSVCDAFDDHICGIGNKQIKVQEAIEYIKKYKNIYFDGNVVDIFLQFVAAYPVGTKVITNFGEEAIVLSQNEHYTDRPVIKMLKTGKGEDYQYEKIVNLAQNRLMYIDRVVD